MVEIEIHSEADGNRTVDLGRLAVVRRIARAADEGQVRAYVLDSTDVPVDGAEITKRGTLIAERLNGLWRDSVGAPLNEDAQQALEAMQTEAAVPTVLVRDGSIPLPPKSYWNDELGRYVSPEDEQWSSDEYRAAVGRSA